MNNKPNTDLESQNQEEEHNEHRAPITREDSGDTERPPPSNQQTATIEKEPRTNTNDNDEKEQEEEDDDSDPSEPVKPLDWSKLEQQYHDSMKQCSQDEAALMQEWSELMNVRALLPSTPTHLPLQY